MNHLLALQVLAVASFNFAPIATDAAPITVPTGLNPGDQYRLVFVTSTTRNAESSNIEDYNTFVTGAANSVPELAAVGPVWKVLGSTFEMDARDNTNTNFMNPGNVGVPIYTVGDTLLAVNNGDLWDGSIANMLAFTEHGNFLSTFAWTGTAPDGTAAFVEFFPPAFLGGGPGVMRGVTTSTTLDWVTAGGAGVSSSHSLYAMSGVLTVVPEPSTIVLMTLAAAGLAVSLARRA